MNEIDMLLMFANIFTIVNGFAKFTGIFFYIPAPFTHKKLGVVYLIITIITTISFISYLTITKHHHRYKIQAPSI